MRLELARVRCAPNRVLIVPVLGNARLRNVAESDVAMPEYRYELRRSDETVATGHLSREAPLEIGERIAIGSRPGIALDVEPLLGEHELRLVVQLTRDEFEY